MGLVDINAIEKQAQDEINEELGKKAKEALKRKLREHHAAQAVANNIQREIELLKQQIAEGKFE
jgi:hypothetical protein